MRDGWAEKTLGQVAEVRIGRQRAPRHAHGDHMVPYLRAANVKDARLQLDDILSMNFTPQEQRTFALLAGDVLVTEGCGSIRELGATARWAGELSGTICFQNTLLRLRPLDGLVTAEYLYLWATHAHHSGVFAAAASGTNIFHIGARRAELLPIRVPPLAEQHRIVHLLMSVEDSLAAVVREVSAFDAAIRAVREIGLAAAPMTVAIGDLVLRIEAGRSPDAEDRRPLPGEASVLKVSAVRPGWFDPTQVKTIRSLDGFPAHARIQTGDLLITRANTRELVGAVCLINEAPHDTYLCDKTLRLVQRADQVSAGYLFEVLQSAVARDQLSDFATGTSGSMKNISQESIRAVRVPLLEGVDQRRLVDVLDGMRSARMRSHECAMRLRVVKERLMNVLLSGERTIPTSYDRFLDAAS